MIVSRWVPVSRSADRMLFGEGYGPETRLGVTQAAEGRYLIYTVDHGWAWTEVHFQDLRRGRYPDYVDDTKGHGQGQGDVFLQRFEALLQANAGSQKQRDDAATRRDVARERLQAAESRVRAADQGTARLRAGAKIGSGAAAHQRHRDQARRETNTLVHHHAGRFQQAPVQTGLFQLGGCQPDERFIL